MSNSFHQLFYDNALNITDVDPRTSNNGSFGGDSYEISLSSNVLTLTDLSDNSKSSSVTLNYLNKNGDVMNGTINMNNNKITNITNPTNNADAVNKSYVDNTLNNTFLPKAGGTMTGDINLNNNKITNIPTPSSNGDAVNLSYFNANTNDFLNKNNGGVINAIIDMSGNRIIDVADPINDKDVANKEFVNTTVNNANYLPLKGSKMEGIIDMDNTYKIINSVNPTSNGDLVNLQYATTELNKCFLKTGGSITGEVVMNNNKIIDLAQPTNDQDGATKKYVDDSISGTSGGFLPLTGGTLTGDLNVGGKTIVSGEYLRIGNSSVGMTIKDEFAHGGNNQISFTSPRPETDFYFGGTKLMGLNQTKSYFTSQLQIQNELDMSNNKIVNLKMPSNNNEATNKEYVDGKIVTNNEDNFKTYNITGRQFNNFGMWGGIVGDPDMYYTKATKVYVPTNPLISTEMINDHIKKNNSYVVEQTPKINPSLFQFYGIVYQDLSNSTIENGRLQVKMNLPYISDVDIFNQDTFMIQGILGKAPTFSGDNIEVECYAVETVNSVHGYSGGYIYGKNIDDSFPNNDQKWIREIELLFNFNIPLDIQANNIYIYLQFTTNNNALQNRYINFLFGGLTSPIASTNSRDLMISGQAIYTKQTTTVLSSETPLDMSYNEADTSFNDFTYVYDISATDNLVVHETYKEEQEITDNNYIHSIKKVSDISENITLYTNTDVSNSIFQGGDENIIIDDIFNASISIKTIEKLTTQKYINLVCLAVNSLEVPPTFETQTIQVALYLNSNDWHNYAINFKELDKVYLLGATIQIPSDIKNVVIDNFQLNYVKDGEIKNTSSHFKLSNDDSILRRTEKDDLHDLTTRINNVENKHNKIKIFDDLLNDRNAIIAHRFSKHTTQPYAISLLRGIIDRGIRLIEADISITQDANPDDRIFYLSHGNMEEIAGSVRPNPITKDNFNKYIINFNNQALNHADTLPSLKEFAEFIRGENVCVLLEAKTNSSTDETIKLINKCREYGLTPDNTIFQDFENSQLDVFKKQGYKTMKIKNTDLTQQEIDDYDYFCCNEANVGVFNTLAIDKYIYYTNKDPNFYNLYRGLYNKLSGCFSDTVIPTYKNLALNDKTLLDPKNGYVSVIQDNQEMGKNTRVDTDELGNVIVDFNKQGNPQTGDNTYITFHGYTLEFQTIHTFKMEGLQSNNNTTGDWMGFIFRLGADYFEDDNASRTQAINVILRHNGQCQLYYLLNGSPNLISSYTRTSTENFMKVRWTTINGGTQFRMRVSFLENAEDSHGADLQFIRDINSTNFPFFNFFNPVENNNVFLSIKRDDTTEGRVIFYDKTYNN